MEARSLNFCEDTKQGLIKSNLPNISPHPLKKKGLLKNLGLKYCFLGETLTERYQAEQCT